MMMKRYHRWKNYGDPGDTVFRTSTILGWTPVFQRAEMRERMTELLFEVHRHHGCQVHSFVVMPEHVHCVTLLANASVSKFLQSLKRHSAMALKPLLTGLERDWLDAHQGRRGFWMEGYRGLYVYSDPVEEIKTEYTHDNPVRRGLCEWPGNYRWSSALNWQNGPWLQEQGPNYERWLESVRDVPVALPRPHPIPPVRPKGSDRARA